MHRASSRGGARGSRQLGQSEGHDGMAAAAAAALGAEGVGEDAASSGQGEEMESKNSDIMAEGAIADYKRGKRFRKLVKMLKTPRAMVAVQRYWRRSLGVLGCLLAVHIVCFAISLVIIRLQTEYVSELSRAGDVVSKAVSASLRMRVLEMLHRTTPATLGGLFSTADKATWAAGLLQDVEAL